MKTAVIYLSKHHGNTKKVLDAIAERHSLTLYDVTGKPRVPWEEYDLIGIASGIYAGSFGKPLLKFVKEQLPDNKKVFLISTSAGPKGGYENTIRKLLSQKPGCEIVGNYMCLGFNTFGPTKLFGGTAKGHPTREELDAAVAFFEGLSEKK